MHVCQCCWSGKERWKSWEKPAPSHSPSHHQQSPRADYFLVIVWLIQPQALQVHGNFSSQCSEQPFFWGRCYDVFSIFLPFSKELADTIGAAWQAPNLAPVENGSSWMLHISWISHQTGYINDSDSPCISSFFQTCSLVKLCQKWHDRAAAQELPRQTEALLGCAIHAAAQHQQHVRAAYEAGKSHFNSCICWHCIFRFSSG